MRDYVEAINSRVVLFDGGMGATLEMFELSSEDYGGLPGKCHEALVLHRPDVIGFLGEHSPVPVHCIPNAGLPVQGPNGETIFPEQPAPLATTLAEFVERYGVNIVGGCCGTTPEHIRAIVERVVGRSVEPRPQDAWGPHLSSMM